jgi:hypothetical protein
MAIIDWPLKVLAPRNAAVAPFYMTRPDQDATNGMSRTVGLTGTKFKVTLVEIPVMTTPKMRAIRAMLGLSEGNRNLVRFHLPDFYGLDGPFAFETAALRASYPLGVPFEEEGLFEGGVGFEVPLRTSALTQAAALNARELFLSEAVPIEGGVWVSIEEACYTITGSFEAGPGVNRVTISPGLRRGVAAGVEMSLAPVFVGRCVTASPGYEALADGRFGLHTLEFVEDLTRFTVI